MKTFILIFTLIVASTLHADVGFAAFDSSKQTVVIVHSYVPGEWTHGINDGFVAALENVGIAVNLETYIYKAIYWQEQSKGKIQEEKKRILKFIKTKKPALVVVCDDEAANLLMTDLYKQKYPTIFTGVNQIPEKLDWMKEIPKPFLAGVLEIYPIDQSITMLKKMKPKAKSISILTSGANETSKIIADEIQDLLESKEFIARHQITLRENYKLKYWEDWKKAAVEANEKDDALWVIVPYDVFDKNDHEVNVADMGVWLSQTLKIPTLGVIPIHTKIGLFTGINLSPQGLGRQAGELAQKFFASHSIQGLGVEKAKYYTFQINVEEARKLGISVPEEYLGIATLLSTTKLPYGR